MMLHWSSIIAGLVSVVGCGYLVGATLLIDRFAGKTPSMRRRSMPGVTILKPLHGAEPGLLENLASFCVQNYSGPVQIVLGAQDPRDDALAVVERLQAEHAAAHFDLVVDETEHGLNRKVSNLVNMWRRVDHEIVVVADSDMRVDRDYLSRVVAALEQRGVGVVTCLYYGLAGTGLWARIAALGINAHFLPSVVVGVGLRLAQPCFGSTIAFRRKALAEIGGFMAVANCLADDYAIGAALRARGYKISIPPIAVGHVCGEMSAQELWQREVRWARTIRSIDPVGYAGLLVTHAFPWALIAALASLTPEHLGQAVTIGIGIASLGCRLVLLRRVESAFGLPPQPYWLVPVRDLLSFAVFACGLFSQSASWKGRQYRFATGGTLVIAGSSSKP
jgi:ceramide glucosyltransferase